MSLSTYGWLLTGHVLGFVVWIAGMLATIYLLRVHALVEGAARDVLVRQEGRTAMLMDLGATLAMVCGLWVAFGTTPNAFKTGAWLHIKLTLVVVVILGAHGFVRAQVKRFRTGRIKALPRALPYVVLAAVAVIVMLGANKNILHK
ncbi:MAG: CopD family protein [Kofleriaceae bacterium]